MVADTGRPGRNDGGSRLIWTEANGGQGILILSEMGAVHTTAKIFV